MLGADLGARQFRAVGHRAALAINNMAPSFRPYEKIPSRENVLFDGISQTFIGFAFLDMCF